MDVLRFLLKNRNCSTIFHYFLVFVSSISSLSKDKQLLGEYSGMKFHCGSAGSCLDLITDSDKVMIFSICGSDLHVFSNPLSLMANIFAMFSIRPNNENNSALVSCSLPKCIIKWSFNMSASTTIHNYN